ncbi:MAG: tyrosine-type recombinase/integrase [Chloroflexi bacterium]|nr:tyrosine-type recombinase/integrase [Chloroflexota bacterium]
MGLDERQNVGKFLMRWLEDSGEVTVKGARTRQSYAEVVRLHLAPELGKIALVKLTPQQVQAVIKKKLAAGLGPRRVQYIHAVLRMALEKALKWGLAARNVAKLVDAPSVPRHEVQPLTPDQARQFLDAVKDNRFEALYMVALSLGLRQAEIFGLRWADMDLDAGTLRVTVSLQRLGGTYRLVAPKTQKSRRLLSLPNATVAALRAHRVRQRDERQQAGDAWEDWQGTGLVFATATGGPLQGATITQNLHRLLERAGLPRVRFHDLRHTAASLLLAQGVAPRMIMEVLGHNQISTTMDIYAHVMPAAMREAADRMDAMLAAR